VPHIRTQMQMASQGSLGHSEVLLAGNATARGARVQRA